MPIFKRCFGGALCAAMLLPLAARADALLKPLPLPDLTRLDAEQARQLAADRVEFDKVRAGIIGPPLAEAYAAIGVAYARAGLKDLAAIALYDATQANPKDSRWLYLRGMVARDLKQDSEARADFEAALAIDKVYLPIRYRLADTLIDLGDLDGARKVLEAAIREPTVQAVAYAMLGQLGVRQKRYTDAIENLLAALKLDPQANQLYKPLAEAYAGVGNKTAAAEATAKIGEAVPQLADPLGLGLYASAQPVPPLQQAEQLLARGRVRAAQSKLADVLHDHPDDVAALSLRARLEASIGNQTAAQQAAEKALKLDGDNAIAVLARGVVYEYAGDDDRAFAYYQRALRADPKLALARLLLGNIEMRRSRFAQATEQYRQFAQLDPGVSAYSHLVAAQVAEGQCARAMKDVSAGQEHSPRDGDLMQLFVRLASTCNAARQEDRDMALDYAHTLYDQQPAPENATALALALAAHGKFTEAQQYQAEAIFAAVRDGDSAAADLYRRTQENFVAKKLPDRPWPAEDFWFKAPRLTAAPLPPLPAQKPAH